MATVPYVTGVCGFKPPKIDRVTFYDAINFKHSLVFANFFRELLIVRKCCTNEQTMI